MPIRARGFTLPELLIVVVIAAVLATLAAPSFSELIENQRAKSAAADIYVALARARSEAITRNTNVTLSAKSGNWANGWQIPDPAVAGTVIEDHESLRNLTVTGPASVTYRSSGRIAGASISFGIGGSFASSNRCVYLDLGGRPTIKVGSC